jgi:hypothetical protein
MFEGRRLKGRLFYLLLAMVLTTRGTQAQSPATTTVSDTVYRADGNPAEGTVLIFWPAFTTSGGQTVAPGTASAILGEGGALSVALVPNVNATPTGTVYTVVYQLNDGTAKTEYWSVPATSPATIARVRTPLGVTGSAAQMASQQFVNAAVASKASDAAVVHLSGTETLTGLKQFSVAPSVPTPILATDAVNKAYVDSAVSSSGSGSYVSKAGDTMSGPLTLPGDPVAQYQASTKHYVDTGMASKADVAAGLVPTSELGTGSPSGTTCLLGNQSWGPCGSSSNAVAIQSVPVDTTAPGDNQVITYVASLGKYEPRAGGGLTAGMQAVKYASDFNWTQSPSADLTGAGAKTVSLSACPLGVTASEPEYYVYIAGTGTAEAAVVTGGTCAGNGLAGTLQFTTVNSHAAGYTVGSASAGLQEALITARFTPANPTGSPQSGKVIVPPGEFNAYARVSIRSSNITVDFSGSIVDCLMNDTCIYAGDSTSSNSFSDITLIGPRGRPMVVNGQHPFVEVNAQKTRVFNVSTRVAAAGASFSSYVQVDDDQSFLLDGLDTGLGQSFGTDGVLCNATTCNPVIYATGGTTFAVGWLKHLNLSLGCNSNGIDWQSGNSLRVSDSVIQGYAQYGLRTGTAHGGLQGTVIDNLYEEVGNCTNPSGSIGQAGIIVQGGPAPIEIRGGTKPAGNSPVFVTTGSTEYRYYVVAMNGTFGPSNPLFAGAARTNGSGAITVTTPDIPGALSFDLLRVTYNAGGPQFQAPNGVGNYAVATGVARSSACSGGICTFTDPQTTPKSYSVAAPAYFPLLNYWPGNLILGSNSDANNISDAATAIVDVLPDNTINELGNLSPSVTAQSCPSVGSWTPAWVSCQSSPLTDTQQAVMEIVKRNNDGGLNLNLKGKVNFGTVGSGPSHIITLSDSNLAKTIATASNRPGNDVDDAFIGFDHGTGDPTQIGISMGAPVSLSNYIANVGDGTNWLERLTASLKEFKTNVQMDGNLVVSGAITGNASTATALAATPLQCNGTFATGIQANGNANCSTADVVQLAETTAPTGLPNYGMFWFDSGCHCAKVLDNNGQAVQLGLTNLFNSDSLGTNVVNVIEERNGTSPQALRVFNSYATPNTWDFFGLDYDNATARYRLWSNDASTGAPGIEFQIQGTVPWYISSNLNLLTGTDNLRDVGADTLGIRNLFFGSFLDGETGGALVTEMANASTMGTTLNSLVKLTRAPSTAVVALTTDTGGVMGVANTNGGTTCTPGTTGKACIVTRGPGICNFDGGVTAGDYVQISSSTGGYCHDAGATYPGSGQVLGRVLVTNASAGAYGTYFFGGDSQGFLSTGTAAATYAPLASPALTGTPTAPTPNAGDSSIKIATTAWVQGQTTGIPWLTVPRAGANTGVTFSTTSNQAYWWGVMLTYPITTTQVTYFAGTADNTGNSYDIGIYDSAGNLKVHTGPKVGTTFAPAVGAYTLSWTGAATLQPGKYYLAITTNCTTSCAALAGDNASAVTFLSKAAVSVSAGGTLNGPITPPADAWNFASYVPAWVVR